VRFGLVGSGFWATTLHGPGLIAHPEVELVGAWGRDLRRSSVEAAQLGVCCGTSARTLWLP
jgi:predicted dehydrogenase